MNPRTPRRRLITSLTVGLPLTALGCEHDLSSSDGAAAFEDTADAVPACGTCDAQVEEIYGTNAYHGSEWAPDATSEVMHPQYRPDEFTGINTVTGLAFDDDGHLYATAVVDPDQANGLPGRLLHFDADLELVHDEPMAAHLWDVASDGRRVVFGGERVANDRGLYARDNEAVAWAFDPKTGYVDALMSVPGSALKTIEFRSKHDIRWGGWTWSDAADTFVPAEGVLGQGHATVEDLGSETRGPFDEPFAFAGGEMLDRATDEEKRSHEVGWAIARGAADPSEPRMWMHGTSEAFDLPPVILGESTGIAVTPCRRGFSLAIEYPRTYDGLTDAPWVLSVYSDDGDHLGFGGFGGPEIVHTVSRAVARIDEYRAFHVVRIDDAVEVWEVFPSAQMIERRIQLPADDIDVFAIAIAPDNAIILGGRRTTDDSPWIGRFTMNELVPLL